MKLGISSYTLPWSIGIPGYDTPAEKLTAPALLEMASENGVHLVQIADNMPLHLMPESELEEIRQLSEELEIVIEVGTRGTSPGHLTKYLELARYFNSRLVRTVIDIPDIPQAERDLKEVLPLYTREGITIAVENHGLHTTGQLASLFQSIDSPYLGSCLDTVNSFGALESPDKVIAQLSPYIKNLHIKDFEIKRHRHQLGFEILGTPAGQGKLNLDLLFDTIRRYGQNPTAILELWPPFTDTLENTVTLEQLWFRQSLDFLSSYGIFDFRGR